MLEGVSLQSQDLSTQEWPPIYSNNYASLKSSDVLECNLRIKDPAAMCIRKLLQQKKSPIRCFSNGKLLLQC